jgi:hypothetical protein
MNTTALIVPPEEIDTVWDKVSGYVRDALSHSQGELEVRHVYSMLQSGGMMMWIIVDDDEGAIVAAVVVEILSYPIKRVCRVVGLGGRGLNQRIHHLSEIEAWAKSIGCDAMDSMCRDAFEKILTPLGYSKQYIIVGKPL